MKRFINPEKIDFRIPHFTDESGDILVSLKEVKKCIAMTPSEDVVSKDILAKEIFMDIDRVVEKFSMGDIGYSEFVETISNFKNKYIKTEPNETKSLERDFFTCEEVRKMSAPEVRLNYAKIINSMSKWH